MPDKQPDAKQRAIDLAHATARAQDMGVDVGALPYSMRGDGGVKQINYEPAYEQQLEDEFDE